jgi:hypothetical protein
MRSRDRAQHISLARDVGTVGVIFAALTLRHLQVMFVSMGLCSPKMYFCVLRTSRPPRRQTRKARQSRASKHRDCRASNSTTRLTD